MKGEFLKDWDQEVFVYEKGSSFVFCVFLGEVLNGIVKKIFFFVGGFVDFVGLNKMIIKNVGDFMVRDYVGKNFWFGVCEFVMGAVLNGMVFYGGFCVFGGIFFVFFDYLRFVICLVLLMGLFVIYVFMYDSIVVGEDGLIYELIEQFVFLCVFFNFFVIRFVDGNEIAVVWKFVV